MRAFTSTHRSRLGLVSLEAPLISNLSVRRNVALIPQYHQNTAWPAASALTDRLLQRLGMASIAEKRNPSLAPEERFCAMLLRAAMVQEAVVVLDRPFGILTNQPDGRFLRETLEKLDELIAEVYIFDYHWEKERYGVVDDPKD